MARVTSGIKAGRKAKIVATTFAATTLLVLLVANLALGDKRIDRQVPVLYAVEDAQFRRSMGVILGPPMIAGNRVEALVNGDRIFPAMLEAIRGAQRTITFETYIYYSGTIGAAFSRALAERARAGVKVHVIFDAVGAGKIDDRFEDEMRAAGVELEKYNPLRWYTLAQMNNRTHRKLLVVDGRVGFTGGVGIADEWAGDAQDPKHWRDTHFRIEGPVVAQLQAAFMENWIEITGRVLHGEAYFPLLAPAGDQTAQFFVSSPGGGGESMQLMYLLSIAAASKSIHLSMAYFAPDTVAMDTLVAALRRGVRIQLLLPGPHTDAEIVQKASRAKWGDLLKNGAEIHLYQPTMFHCKVLVVDVLWTSVGSTNFDNRSFRLNDEANLNIYDAEVAAQQVALFHEDLKKSRRVTYEEWEARPWREKLLERAAALLNAQL